MRRIVVAADLPDRETIGQAASVLREGGIAAIPTDTLYGLAADPFNGSAVARLFTIKDRAKEKALPLVAGSRAQIEMSLGALSPLASRLADAFWPGPLTLIVPAPPTLAPEVTGGSGTVAVRVPDHAATRALCDACERPLTATSANRSGEPPTADPTVVEQALGALIDLLVDAGQTPGGPPSTIVDVTDSEPRLVRAGATPWDAVLTASRLE